MTEELDFIKKNKEKVAKACNEIEKVFVRNKLNINLGISACVTIVATVLESIGLTDADSQAFYKEIDDLLQKYSRIAEINSKNEGKQ